MKHAKLFRNNQNLRKVNINDESIVKYIRSSTLTCGGLFESQ